MLPTQSIDPIKPQSQINDLALYYEKKKSAMNLELIKLMPERQVFKVSNKSPIQVMTI